MTGGMSKRGAWGTMAERIADGTPGQINHAQPLHRPPGGSDIEPWHNTARHCWVIISGGREPGLLLDWRRSARGQYWEGLVVRQIPHGFTATWIADVMLEPSAPLERP